MAFTVIFISFITMFMIIWRFCKNQHLTLQLEGGVPVIPGERLLIGHMWKIDNKFPCNTYSRWAEQYGPIFSVKIGATNVVVLNNKDVIEEALIVKGSSICPRLVSTPLSLLTNHQCMVAMNAGEDFSMTLKEHLNLNMIARSQVIRYGRRDMTQNMCNMFSDHLQASPNQCLSFREIFQSELFRFTLNVVFYKDIDSIYVREMNQTLTRMDLYKILVLDYEEAVRIDDYWWSKVFPCLKPVSNIIVHIRLRDILRKRTAVIEELMHQHWDGVLQTTEKVNFGDKLIISREGDDNEMSMEHLKMLIWESVIVWSSHNSMVKTLEWAMFELAKNPYHQDILYHEINYVCGTRTLTEDHLERMPYLNAVFLETLRRHSPVPLIIPRYALEDTEIGGYHIPTGTHILVNSHACNMDRNRWDNPNEWNPERFLGLAHSNDELLQTIMSFGTGSRMCPGAQQARLIIMMAVGRFVQCFHWYMEHEDSYHGDYLGLLTCYRDPLKIKIRRRDYDYVTQMQGRLLYRRIRRTAEGGLNVG